LSLKQISMQCSLIFEEHYFLGGSQVLTVCPPLTAENRVRSQVSPYEIFHGQTDTVTGFPPSISVSPCQYHSTNAPHPSSSTLLLPEGQMGQAWELSEKQRYLGNRVALIVTLVTIPCEERVPQRENIVVIIIARVWLTHPLIHTTDLIQRDYHYCYCHYIHSHNAAMALQYSMALPVYHYTTVSRCTTVYQGMQYTMALQYTKELQYTIALHYTMALQYTEELQYTTALRYTMALRTAVYQGNAVYHWTALYHGTAV
jgi:hypothetical protein